MRHGRQFPVPLIEGKDLGTQVRHWTAFIYHSAHQGRTKYPGKGTPADTEELKARQYYPKSRQQWDYERINEYVTHQSEFTKMENRPDFDGPREAGYPDVDSYAYTNPPQFKKLHEYFDDYTQPGMDPKVAAARAVQEQWDSESFYYPGEAYQRNRPGFRSVPKEMLNKQTWYFFSDFIFKQNEMQAISRPRQFNPMWPPPGYKVPKLACRRDFVFGVEEPGLVHEIERYYWYKMWWENNLRHGPMEFWLWIGLLCACYFTARYHQAYYWKQRVMFGNMWYPGRSLIRAFGEPRNAEEGWWWQRPLEDKSWFPEQGLVWYYSEVRFGYAAYLKQEEERKKLEAVVS